MAMAYTYENRANDRIRRNKGISEMRIEKVRKAIEEFDDRSRSTVKYECFDDKLEKVLKAVMPLVEAAIALHEFNKRVGIFMSPAQEIEKVHLFDDYLKAIEKLVTE